MANIELTNKWIIIDSLIENFNPALTYQLQNRGLDAIETSNGDPTIQTSAKFILSNLQVAKYKKGINNTYIRAQNTTARLSISTLGS